jgi:hypothetical protein
MRLTEEIERKAPEQKDNAANKSQASKPQGARQHTNKPQGNNNRQVKQAPATSGTMAAAFANLKK